MNQKGKTKKVLMTQKKINKRLVLLIIWIFRYDNYALQVHVIEELHKLEYWNFDGLTCKQNCSG